MHAFMLCLALVATGKGPQQPTYLAQRIGPVGTADQSRSADINDRGVAVGYAAINFASPPAYAPWIWEAQTGARLLTNAPAASPYISAAKINNAGTIAGGYIVFPDELAVTPRLGAGPVLPSGAEPVFVDPQGVVGAIPVNTQGFGFFWTGTQPDVTRPLPGLGLQTGLQEYGSAVIALNNDDKALCLSTVGTSFPGDIENRPCLLDMPSGRITDLSRIVPDGYTLLTLNDRTDQGMICGTVLLDESVSFGATRAFVWSAADGFQLLPTLGDLPGRVEQVTVDAMNNRGQVVGRAQIVVDTGQFLVLFVNGERMVVPLLRHIPLGAYLWTPGEGMQSLGEYFPVDLNDNAEILGLRPSAVPSFVGEGFIWRGSRWTSLNTLIPELVEATNCELDLEVFNEIVISGTAINNRGQILSDISFSGDQVLFPRLESWVFTPTRRGVVGDVNRDGTVDFLDIYAVMLALGPCTERGCAADVNNDCHVNQDDVLAILETIGR
jgi:hypothetical protein